MTTLEPVKRGQYVPLNRDGGNTWMSDGQFFSGKNLEALQKVHDIVSIYVGKTGDLRIRVQKKEVGN